VISYGSTETEPFTLEHFQDWHPATEAPEETWIAPSIHWFNINFDTAIRDSFSSQAVVCCDSKAR
jgi:hypothetical protein